MPNTEADRAARILKTREAAWTMHDDLKHLRDLLQANQPSTGEVRRMSNQLRRLLIDNGGDIVRIAAPRLQRKLMLQVPDFKSEARATDERDTLFITLGGGGIFGSQLERFEIAKPGISVDGKETATLMGTRPDPSDPSQLIEVNLEGFLAQPVVFIDGKWFSRGQVLKYVANEAGGVHSGSHSDSDVAMLRMARTFGAFYQHEGSLALRLDVDASMRGRQGIDVVRYGVDFILLQVFSAAKFLLGSRDVQYLDRIIAAEFPAEQTS